MSATFYWELYQSVGIANRVVNVFPEECWSVNPELYETEEDKTTSFEQAWQDLNQDGMIWSFLNRADELSGIGAYGALFLGFADLTEGEQTTKPVPGVGDDGRSTGIRTENKLLFCRVYDQSNVEIVRYESDLRNPRFGQPLEYRIRVMNPAMGASSTTEGSPSVSQTTSMTHLNVHWSRVIHVADNRKSSEIFGLPRMKPVLPEIMDIRKIRGSSAEMFWRGAFPGYAFESNPDLGVDVEIDRESIEEEFQNYVNGLQRYMAMAGATVKELAPQIGDPSHHLDEQYRRSIGATLGVPARILIGAESAHLASHPGHGDVEPPTHQATEYVHHALPGQTVHRPDDHDRGSPQAQGLQADLDRPEHHVGEGEGRRGAEEDPEHDELRHRRCGADDARAGILHPCYGHERRRGPGHRQVHSQEESHEVHGAGRSGQAGSVEDAGSGSAITAGGRLQLRQHAERSRQSRDRW